MCRVWSMTNITSSPSPMDMAGVYCGCPVFVCVTALLFLSASLTWACVCLCRSILTVPWVELGGECNISCSKSGYSANIVFHTKPFYGGKKHRITAEILWGKDVCTMHIFNVTVQRLIIIIDVTVLMTCIVILPVSLAVRLMIRSLSAPLKESGTAWCMPSGPLEWVLYLFLFL